MPNSLILMSVYVGLTIVLQLVFYIVSLLFAKVAPDWSLLLFLTLFLCAFGLAWPPAVRLTEPKVAAGEASSKA